MNDTVNIGEYCVHCFHSVAPGSGRFVNRIPADVCSGLNYLRLDGYACAECMILDCDRCGKGIALDEDITPDMCNLDGFADHADRVCEDCLTNEEKEREGVRREK